MWLASLVSSLALVAVAAEAPVAATARLPEPIATRQYLFAIPFRIAEADHPSREPREVQLHVSGDRGASWQLYARSEPSQKQFLFRAALDGEYWFAVRTVDQAGQARPERFAAPEMRVVIDTVPPKVELTAQAGDDGQMTAQWRIEEALLAGEAVKLTYRVGPEGPWQPVPIESRNMTPGGAVHAGEATWQLPVTVGEIQVRAEVCDAAGNSAVHHAPVLLAARDNNETSATQAASREPAAATNEANEATTWASEPYPVAGGGHAAPAKPYAPPPVEAFQPAATHPAVARNADAPTAEGVRWIDSRRFELEYDVDPSAGPVHRVELWGTSDEGRTWHTIAVDEDRQSPIAVAVGAEGVYGFRIVIQQAGAPAARPPQPGERPELLIGVK